MLYNAKRIEEDIRKNLSKFRYEHTIRVAEEAKCLSKNYQIDEEKAYVAALLHDIGKELSKEENENFIKKYKLPNDLKKKEFASIIHADIGAEIAREKYNVDESIFKAIKYHTIGNENMDLLAKVVFVADKIGRENLNSKLQEIKKIAYENIDDAIKLLFLIEEDKLKNKGLKLHPDTVKLLNKMKDKKS